MCEKCRKLYEKTDKNIINAIEAHRAKSIEQGIALSPALAPCVVNPETQDEMEKEELAILMNAYSAMFLLGSIREDLTQSIMTQMAMSNAYAEGAAYAYVRNQRAH